MALLNDKLKFQEQETFKVLIPNHFVKKFIGQKGSKIKEIAIKSKGA